MNTLGKSITCRFFVSEAGYRELKSRWSALVQSGEPLSAADHLLYLVLRGKDWRKSFVLATNSVKVENGACRGDGPAFVRAQQKLCLGYTGHFADLLSEESVRLIPRLLPKVGWSENALPDSAYMTEAL